MKMSALIYLTVLSALYDVSFAQNVSNETHRLIVKKCMCSASQVDQMNVCKETAGDLFVQLWDPAAGKEQLLDLKKQLYTVEPLSCTEGFSKEIFYEWAFLLQDGKLMKASMDPTEEYCIESLVLEDGSVGQKIELCVESPKLPLCCGNKEFLNEKGQCVLSKHDNVEPKWPEFFDYNPNRPLNCGELGVKAEPLQMEFEGEVNAMFSFFQHQGIDFCLGQHESSDSTHKTFYLFCNMPDPSMSAGRTVGGKTHVPFCCPDGHAFDMDTAHKCIPHVDTFGFPDNIIFDHPEFVPIATQMNCTDKTILESHLPGEQFIIQKNGSMTSEHRPLIELNEYCLGLMIKNNESFHSGLTCFMSSGPSRCPWRYVVLQICLVISTLFFMLTLAVYIGLGPLRKKIGGACLISELIALIISQITLLVLQTSQHDMHSKGCLTAGLIEVISVLASFFWLNVMCYDVWTGLRVFRPAGQGGFKTKRFLKYSAYAWGCPLLIGMIALILEKTNSPIRPNFTPQTGCFFTAEDVARQWGYMYGFILAILLMNLCFFLHLAVTLVPTQLEARRLFGTRKAGREGGATKDSDVDKENVVLYLKLFLLMGIPWLIEVFTSFAQGEMVCYLWYLDIINALRGIFIFAIFVCKKKTLNMICKSTESGKPSASTSSTSRKTSTISLSSLGSHFRKISKASTTTTASSGGVQGPIREEKEP